MAYLNRENTERIALLNDGSKTLYDACSKKRYNVYDSKYFKYIGEGIIYSIGGVKQSSNDDKYYFWRKRNR